MPSFPFWEPQFGKRKKTMSKQSGDTARFHRIRKQNTARRLKSRELRVRLAAAAAAAVPLADAVKVKVPVV
jgi:hypothetical protein